MTIEIPDEVARGLAEIAAAQRKSVEQLAVDSLCSLLDKASSPGVVLGAVRQLAHPSAAGPRSRRVRQLIAGMTYLLDTNAVSDLMRAAPRIENWMAGLDPGDRVVTCTIVRGEILFGIARLPAGRRRTELEETSQQFLAVLRCEPVPEQAADFYAAVKLDRQRRGLNLDENDLRIAATALALGATLVSRDSDFQGLNGLALVVLA